LLRLWTSRATITWRKAAQEGQAQLANEIANGKEILSGILPGEQKARKLEDVPYDTGMQFLQAHPDLLHDRHLALTGHRTGPSILRQVGRTTSLYTLYRAAEEGPLSPQQAKKYVDLDPRLKPILMPARVFSSKEGQGLEAHYLGLSTNFRGGTVAGVAEGRIQSKTRYAPPRRLAARLVTK
jgi:hypothetical protein